MPPFTLKIIYDETSGYLKPDVTCDLGGTDVLQGIAFRHLLPDDRYAPDGNLSWIYRDLLYDMAMLHGWTVSVTTLP